MEKEIMDKGIKSHEDFMASSLGDRSKVAHNSEKAVISNDMAKTPMGRFIRRFLVKRFS